MLLCDVQEKVTFVPRQDHMRSPYTNHISTWHQKLLWLIFFTQKSK